MATVGSTKSLAKKKEKKEEPSIIQKVGTLGRKKKLKEEEEGEHTDPN